MSEKTAWQNLSCPMRKKINKCLNEILRNYCRFPLYWAVGPDMFQTDSVDNVTERVQSLKLCNARPAVAEMGSGTVLRSLMTLPIVADCFTWRKIIFVDGSRPMCTTLTLVTLVLVTAFVIPLQEGVPS